jgi:hypothetical protein
METILSEIWPVIVALVGFVLRWIEKKYLSEREGVDLSLLKEQEDEQTPGNWDNPEEKRKTGPKTNSPGN